MPARPPRTAHARTVDDDAASAAIVHRIAHGDLTALGELYTRYHADVRRHASRVLGNSADADDVTHATFLALPSIAVSFDGRPPRPWLLGIATRLALRHRRGIGRFLATMTAMATSRRDETARDAESEAVAREEVRQFERALARIAAKKRAVFVLVEVEGMTTDDVARELGVPVATVRTRLHYARQELRAAMNRGGAW